MASTWLDYHISLHYNKAMLPKKTLYSPWMLATAFALPFAIVIGLATLLIWSTCLLTGMDTASTMSNFFAGTASAVYPVVEILLTVWLTYFLVIYTPIAYTTANSLLLTIGRAAQVALLKLFSSFTPPLSSRLWIVPALLEKARLFLRDAGAHTPSLAGWLPGTHPQLA